MLQTWRLVTSRSIASRTKPHSTCTPFHEAISQPPTAVPADGVHVSSSHGERVFAPQIIPVSPKPQRHDQISSAMFDAGAHEEHTPLQPPIAGYTDSEKGISACQRTSPSNPAVTSGPNVTDKTDAIMPRHSDYAAGVLNCVPAVSPRNASLNNLVIDSQTRRAKAMLLASLIPSSPPAPSHSQASKRCHFVCRSVGQSIALISRKGS